MRFDGQKHFINLPAALKDDDKEEPNTQQKPLLQD